VLRPDPERTMSGKRRVILALKFAVSAALIVLLYRRVDFARIGSMLLDVRIALLGLFFLLLFANTLISAVKWKLFLRADGVAIGLVPLLASYLVGTFFNVFLPSNIGGDAYRIYDIARRSAKPVHTAASVFADRLSGFAALAALGLLFPALGYGLVSDHRLMLLPLITFTLIAAVIVSLYRRPFLEKVLAWVRADRIAWVQRFTGRFLDSIAQYRKAPGIVWRVMGCSFLFQFTVIVCVFVLARAIGLAIPFFYFCIFVPVICLMEAIPLSIYGLGLRDAGYVLFFSQIGRPPEEALSLAVLYVAASLVYASSGGVVFALRFRPRPPAAPGPADKEGP